MSAKSILHKVMLKLTLFFCFKIALTTTCTFVPMYLFQWVGNPGLMKYIGYSSPQMWPHHAPSYANVWISASETYYLFWSISHYVAHTDRISTRHGASSDWCDLRVAPGNCIPPRDTNEKHLFPAQVGSGWRSKIFRICSNYSHCRRWKIFEPVRKLD